MNICPHCRKPLSEPVGLTGDVLLVTLEPESLDRYCLKLLHSEMARAGFSVTQYRMVSLWGHPLVDERVAPQEFGWHFQRCLNYIQTAEVKYIVLLGTVTGIFLEQSVKSASGLWWPCKYLDPEILVTAAPDPLALLRTSLGELRLTLARLQEKRYESKARPPKIQKVTQAARVRSLPRKVRRG